MTLHWGSVPAIPRSRLFEGMGRQPTERKSEVELPWSQMTDVLADERVWAVIRALLILVVGAALARLAGSAVARGLSRYTPFQRVWIVRRAVFYVILALVVISSLRELGFDLSILLGAAGILTVAVGFASQTSASNLISGMFLIGERTFSPGDVITIGGTTGEVLSIDLLSVKLRTFDNLRVRIPNETLIKSEVTNLTAFPVRRLDLRIGVAYKEDIARVQSVLERVAAANPQCLEDPAPVFIFLGFGESSMDIQFSVWATQEDFLELRNGIYREIKEAFDAEGIEIPYPHRAFHPGTDTAPFPVRLVAQRGFQPGEGGPGEGSASSPSSG